MKYAVHMHVGYVKSKLACMHNSSYSYSYMILIIITVVADVSERRVEVYSGNNRKSHIRT